MDLKDIVSQFAINGVVKDVAFAEERRTREAVNHGIHEVTAQHRHFVC